MLGEEFVVRRPSQSAKYRRGSSSSAISNGSPPRPVGNTARFVFGSLADAFPRLWNTRSIPDSRFLTADTAEECGKPVVVLLAPFLKRVMVTASTLNAKPKEQLCNLLPEQPCFNLLNQIRQGY